MQLYTSDDCTVEILEGRLARLYELTHPNVIAVSDIGWTDEDGFMGDLNPAKLVPFGQRAQHSYDFTSFHAENFNYPNSYDLGAEAGVPATPDDYVPISEAGENLAEIILSADESNPVVIKVGGAATDVWAALMLAQWHIDNGDGYDPQSTVLDGRVQIWADLFTYNETDGWGVKHFNNSFDYFAAAGLAELDLEQQRATGIPLLYVIPLDQIATSRKVSKSELAGAINANPGTVGSTALQSVLDDWNAEPYYPSSHESSAGLGHTLMILNQNLLQVQQVEAPTFDENGKIENQHNADNHLLHVVRGVDKASLDLLIAEALDTIASFEGYEEPEVPEFIAFPIDLDGATVAEVSTGHSTDETNQSFQDIIGQSLGTIMLPLAPPANDPDGEPIVWNARIFILLDNEEFITYEVNLPDPDKGYDDPLSSFHTEGRNRLDLVVYYEQEPPVDPECPDYTEKVGEIESYLSMADTLFDDATELAQQAAEKAALGQAQLNQAQQLLARLLED